MNCSESQKQGSRARRRSRSLLPHHIQRALTADLVVTQTDSADPAPSGAELTYTVTVRNAGPGEAVDVSIQLWPIAALVRAGHSIRIAIAGADADMFDPIPAGATTLTVHRGGSSSSRIVLPVVEGGLR